MRIVIRGCVVLLLAATLPLLAIAQEAPASDELGEPTLEELYQLLERYKDVEVALADGYIRDPMNMCESADAMGLPASDGGMGIHFFRPDLLAITDIEPRVNGMGTHTDFRQPAILLYEPQEDGSLVLVGAENLVFRDAWYAAGHEGPPTFHGRTWDFMENDPTTELDEAHGFEAHYDLHVWVFRDHPSDVFSPFNPNVTCEYHVAEVQH
jgi:hypothetical protein